MGTRHGKFMALAYGALVGGFIAGSPAVQAADQEHHDRGTATPINT